MEQFSDKLLTNIPETGEYTVVLIMLHKERLQNILNNAINLLAPLGYSFNIIYKDDDDIKDVKPQYNYINWLKNAPIDYKLRFLLIGKPKKILLFDTDT
jgi:hypothetical protein